MSLALSAGVRFFQYRDKNGSRRAVYQTASRLALIAKEAHALFIVNDHADISAAVDADGVHLGQDDLPIDQARKILEPGKLIGISTHGREQAEAAEKAGADYLGYGPVFSTRTKDAGEPKGIAALKLVKQAVRIPVIAIGGITQANIAEVIRAGADGAAVISAILSAADITRAAADMVAEISRAAPAFPKTLSDR